MHRYCRRCDHNYNLATVRNVSVINHPPRYAAYLIPSSPSFPHGPAPHVCDDGLATLIHMHMFNASTLPWRLTLRECTQFEPDPDFEEFARDCIRLAHCDCRRLRAKDTRGSSPRLSTLRS